MSSSWEDSFRKGVDAFRTLDYQAALGLFDTAIARGGDRYKVYDSRAAVYEKIGKAKNALKDSRKVIELAPHMRHGYTRSARLFLSLGKHDTALEMARLALDRISSNDTVHRSELEELQRAILGAKDIRTARETRKKPIVDKLPVELISEIFIFAAEIDPVSPIYVSLVCSHWRAVALSMPMLWCRISLSDIRPVRKMELWQERSKERITSLWICSSISRLQLQDALAKCGSNFCGKLKVLHSEVDLVLLWSCLMNVPNFHHLDLEEIYVSQCNRNQLGPFTPSLPFPSHCVGSMRSLVVEHANVDWTEAVPRLAHLRTLVIRTSHELPSAALVCTLFVSNPLLEEVILETRTPWELNVAAIDQRIELPHLSHLQLLGPMDANWIISRLSLPNLQRLAISQCLRKVDQAIFALDPSFPALTELSIRKCSFAEDRLASFLQHMQALNKLEITHSASRLDLVVDAIACSHDGMEGESRLVCPGLEHVDFSHCPHLNGGPVVRLVRSRSQGATTPSTRIKVLHIDGCPKVDPAVPEWLKTRVDNFSCVYMTKIDIQRMRRRQGVYQ